MTMQKFLASFALTIALGVSAQGNAALITWQSPVDQTGLASDIINTGTFVDSAYVGIVEGAGDITVNGVLFNGESSFINGSLAFNNSQIQVNNMISNFSHAGTPLTGWDPNYQALTAGGAFAPSSSHAALVLNGLTVGQNYTLQILEGPWNENLATSFGGSDPVFTTGSGSLVPQYVIGTFTADSAMQTLDMASNSGYVLFEAVQLRTDGAAATPSVPEPASLSLLGAGLAGLGMLRRRYRL